MPKSDAGIVRCARPSLADAGGGVVTFVDDAGADAATLGRASPSGRNGNGKSPPRRPSAAIGEPADADFTGSPTLPSAGPVVKACAGRGASTGLAPGAALAVAGVGAGAADAAAVDAAPPTEDGAEAGTATDELGTKGRPFAGSSAMIWRIDARISSMVGSPARSTFCI